MNYSDTAIYINNYFGTFRPKHVQAIVTRKQWFPFAKWLDAIKKPKITYDEYGFMDYNVDTVNEIEAWLQLWSDINQQHELTHNQPVLS